MDQNRKRRFRLIIVAYPAVLAGLGLGLNMLLFGIPAIVIALPAPQVVTALIVAAILLTLNHTWLMTATELTRLAHNMHASPEEWAQSGTTKADVAPAGWTALERHHNAHRNATENTVIFAVLAGVFAVVTPVPWAATVWIIGFGLARLGYTYAALRGKTGLRGFCMSASLLCLFAIASYLTIALILTP